MFGELYGGVAPSAYLAKIESKGQVSPDVLDGYLASHFLDVPCCREDDFDHFILLRAKALLDCIEEITGKTISDRDSEEVIKEFGGKFG